MGDAQMGTFALTANLGMNSLKQLPQMSYMIRSSFLQQCKYEHFRMENESCLMQIHSGNLLS